MTSESILLIGRETRNAREVFATQATRLAALTSVETIEVATYEEEPIRELRDQLQGITADRVYAVPMCTAHTHDTLNDVPAVLSYVPGEVYYCDPVGGSPAVTGAIEARAAARVPPADDVTLVLVGFGSSSKPHHRRTADYHAARIREGADYGDVVTCYLLQNPAVECVRYNIATDRAVAVPLFLSRSAATEESIPAELELDRGGLVYTDPLGDHPRIADAVHAEVERQRALASADGLASPSLVRGEEHRPVATDGEGL
ncbi:CbiX/SirB N-terminal domain-containing protein [Natronomonas sp. EA1]|uniref:CbiX/SirB N-terminal domain-containing protein n=1 Tax=Natronomonas sp. EA1 TaxID=3421655 RepID=UPI003EBE8479